MTFLALLPAPACARHAGTRTRGRGGAGLAAASPAVAPLSFPTDEQERIGKWLLDELASEREWQKRFAGSQDALSKLAQEARDEVAAGKATDLDPQEL